MKAYFSCAALLVLVLGLDAARIADAFLISPKTMGQRLVHAKIRFATAAFASRFLTSVSCPTRLSAVLEAIYAAFGIGWDAVAGVDQRGRDLAEEAIWLARVLLQLICDEPEVRGLLALMLYGDLIAITSRLPNSMRSGGRSH